MQECEAPGSDNDEIYYDADAEERDQADGSEAAPIKDEYYRNNQIVGVFSGWKCRSLIPVAQFIRMLDKNAQPTVREVELSEDPNTQAQEIVELKEMKDENLAKLDEQRRLKTEKNLIPLKFKLNQKVEYPKHEPWVDKINSRDVEYGKKTWLDELMGQLPYKDDMNYAVDIDTLKKMDVVTKDIQ